MIVKVNGEAIPVDDHATVATVLDRPPTEAEAEYPGSFIGYDVRRFELGEPRGTPCPSRATQWHRPTSPSQRSPGAGPTWTGGHGGPMHPSPRRESTR